MGDKKDLHVTKRPSGDWQVKREGAERASSTHRTQAEAAEQARDQARREHVEVVIHRPDGRIRDSDSYGNDPCPPEDRKH